MKLSSLVFIFMARQPYWAWAPSCWGFENTLRHITLGRTPLDEWSARRRDLYRATRNTRNKTDIHAPSGIRNPQSQQLSGRGPTP